MLVEQAGVQRDRLSVRMVDAETVLGERFFATIVSVEEQLRGWLSYINRFKQVHQQLSAYARLQGVVDFYADLDVLPFDTSAAALFAQLRRDGNRIGTMDLKIGSIALTHDALLLTANSTDFEKVPGLRIENWLV